MSKYDKYHDSDVVRTAKEFATPLMVGDYQKYGKKIASIELEAAEKISASKAAAAEAKAAKIKFKADAERIAYEHTASMASILENDDEIREKLRQKRSLYKELSAPDLSQDVKDSLYEEIHYIDDVLMKLGYKKPERSTKKTTTK